MNNAINKIESTTSSPSGSGHQVEFYDTEKTLCKAVAEFLEPGIKSGDLMIVIVTPQHREGIFQVLQSRGFAVDDLVFSKQLVWLNARAVLAAFMDGDVPNAELFNRVVGKIFEDTRAGRDHLAIRAFGEMVDILCRDGNHNAAILLEQLWNHLGKTHGFFLTCAYALGNFYNEVHWRHYREICEQHQHVALVGEA